MHAEAVVADGQSAAVPAPFDKDSAKRLCRVVRHVAAQQLVRRAVGGEGAVPERRVEVGCVGHHRGDVDVADDIR